MVIYILLIFYFFISIAGFILYFGYKRIHFNDRPFFKSLPSDKIIGAEVGVYKGENAERILKKYPNIKRLYLIDPYDVDKETDYGKYSNYNSIDLNEAYRIAKEKISPWKSKVIFIKKKSIDALQDLPNNLDFIYIDAQHDEEPVYQDIKYYIKKLNKNGIIGGHDYYVKGVNKAVKRFSSDNNYQLYHNFPDWWFKK